MVRSLGFENDSESRKCRVKEYRVAHDPGEVTHTGGNVLGELERRIMQEAQGSGWDLGGKSCEVWKRAFESSRGDCSLPISRSLTGSCSSNTRIAITCLG